jgi:hypothetical protein
MSATKPHQNGFSPRTMIALVLVGIVCFTGIGLISSFEPELKSGNDGNAHALSNASIGYSGLARVIGDAGQATVMSRRELDDAQERSTLVLAPTLQTQEDQIEDARLYGPTIVLLPKWFTQRDPEKRGWSQLVSDIPAKDVLELLPEDWLEGVSTDIDEAKEPQRVTLRYKSFVKNEMVDFGTTRQIDALRTISGTKWISVVAGPNGGAVIAKHRTENVYVVADPDIFNNAGMSNFANAKLAAHFFADIAENNEPIVFDLTLNGFQRQPNLGRVALEPPILGATLCLFLATVLIALQAAARFLPPNPIRRAVALGKRALADNTAGLIRMGRREHRMAVPYANLLKRQVSKAIAAPANLDPVALTATLDKVSELSKSHLRFSGLIEKAGAATTADDLVAVAKDLHRWKQETTREHQ